MATTTPQQPAKTPVKKLNFAYPFRKASEAPGDPSADFTDQHEFHRLLRKEPGGAYAVSRKGMWHGGIHITDAGAGASLDLKHGVRCMADGEVVAWRVNRTYLTSEIPERGDKAAFSAQFSAGFALVRHVMEFPKDNTLTFFSLYMHLQDFASYEADKALPRPSYWTTWLRVTDAAGDKPDVSASGVGAPAEQTGLRVRTSKPGGTILGILPRGAQFSLLKRDGNWGQIDSVHVSAMVPPKVGGYVAPDAAEKRWIYLGKENGAYVVETVMPDTSLDRVVVPLKPVPIDAGDLIGHIGRFDSLGEQVPARMVHLEMFCDDSIQSFIETSRAWVTEHGAKPKAWEQLGLPADPTILRIDRRTTLYKNPNQEGQDAPLTDVVQAYTLAELGQRAEKPYTETSAGSDGEKMRWWKIDSADVRRQDITGWVREQNFAGGRISREFPQKWVDFEILHDPHDSTHTIFASTQAYVDYSTGADVPNAGAIDKLNPLMQAVCRQLYATGDGSQAANDLCVASQDAWAAMRASRLIVKHESEWANPDKWKQLITEIEKKAGPDEAHEAERKRIQTLAWWEAVKEDFPALPAPQVFHIHPIGMIGNFMNAEDCKCGCCYVSQFSVTKRGPSYGPVYWGNNPLEKSSVLVELADSGEITASERRILVAMSTNEGNLDAVQSYDSEVLTAGAMQKTINPSGEGEFPTQVLKFREDDNAAYRELFEKCGWSVERSGNSARMYYTHHSLTEGKPKTGGDLMDIIRKGCSAQNFGKKIDNIPLASIVRAISDPRFERRQVIDFLVRLRDRILPFRPNGYQYNIASYFQSDLGRATALDHHVNRPYYVERDIGRSLDRFFANHPNVSRNPAEWGAQRSAHEMKVVEHYGHHREMAAGVASPRYVALKNRIG
ncbi:chitinase [Cupriavidus sp. SK-3]|uniref:hypothetical protein n=1 Tax=Cupriavidus sp. SK-3 TaxID=1470558 RepID=UPI00044CC349|nr:hypothetical protein [Cupriavidus sp. SK-3]KDP83511.1 chitinase [Cupriavidus sp. SK-3]